MRIIAFIILIVSAFTLVPVSGVALRPESSDPDCQVITVLDVCSQHDSGLFSGLDMPYVFESASVLAGPCCHGRVNVTPPPSYVFIHYFELDYPPKV